MTNKVHTVYKVNNERVPSVTTIIGQLDKPALLNWAWNCGLRGEDYKKVRDKAASIGTIAHYLCECYLKKETPKLDSYSKEDIEKAETAYLAFLDFVKKNSLEIVFSEKSLIHNNFKYGGTVDIYAKLNGKLALLDLKTSSGVYPEMRLQLAAYKEMLEFNEHKVEETHLLRIDKETGEFTHYFFNDLKKELELFLMLRKVYDLKKDIWKTKE